MTNTGSEEMTSQRRLLRLTVESLRLTTARSSVKSAGVMNNVQIILY
jgi:hypothetical protein